MHCYKTLEWWIIFRCQYTLTINNQLRGCLNPPCLVLFFAVDVVAKHSSVIKTNWMQARRLPKAFVSSAGILNLPITSLPVDNFKDRALWCKPTDINYNMHGWILCRYCATGWFWWISGLRAVTMWSSASFTKRVITPLDFISLNKGVYCQSHINRSFSWSTYNTGQQCLRVLQQLIDTITVWD